MEWREASYTAELALLLPVILFVLFMPLHMGYELYGQTQNASKPCWDKAFCAEEKVRKLKFAENISEELK